MKARWHIAMMIAVAASALGIGGVASAQVYNATQDQVLTQGPVHEAFAEVIQLTPQPGIVVTHEPPQAIEEVPPDERPADPSVVWIPGYWSWDDDRNDFIWVSGVWRIPPPGRTWVPGYWNPVAGGWQWISGFWAPARMEEIEYLPPAPMSLDTGPNCPAPGPDYLWQPGYWQWKPGGWFSHARYVWVPGCWRPVRPGWVWVPAHYVWTCRGYIFVAGYWDYAPEARGLLFAPVYFPRYTYAQASFQYCPSFCIDIGVIIGNLFCRPQYGHYYFGDYYDAGYARRGIYPWFERVQGNAWCSPFIEYTAWRHEREQPRWTENARREFSERRDHRELRPEHTFRALESQMRHLPDRDRARYSIASPLSALAAAIKTPFHMERVSADTRQRYAEQGHERRQLTFERARWEHEGAKGGPGKELKSSKVKFPKHEDLVTQPPSHREGGFTPPQATPFGKQQGRRETKGQPATPATPVVPQVTTPPQRSFTPQGTAPGKHEERREMKGQPATPVTPAVPQVTPPQQRTFTPQGTTPGKHEERRETKGHKETPVTPVAPQVTPPPLTHKEGGFTPPQATPFGKQQGRRETKGQQPAPVTPVVPQVTAPPQRSFTPQGTAPGKHKDRRETKEHQAAPVTPVVPQGVTQQQAPPVRGPSSEGRNGRNEMKGGPVAPATAPAPAAPPPPAAQVAPQTPPASPPAATEQNNGKRHRESKDRH